MGEATGDLVPVPLETYDEAGERLGVVKYETHTAVKGMSAVVRARASRRWRVAIISALFSVALPRERDLTATMFGQATHRP